MNDEMIVRVAARGDGVTASGRHVAGAAPGDTVAPDGAVIPGPHHATPPCPHFGTCGGCSLQHLDDKALADFVRERVTGPLIAKGLTISEVRPVHLSPPRSRRRASLRYTRMKSAVTLGFAGQGSHDLVNIRSCEIVAPRLFDVMTAVRGLVAKWPKPKLSGQVELAEIDQGIDVLITGLAPSSVAEHEMLSAFAETQGLARLSIDQGYGPETQYEPVPVTVSFGDVAVRFPHASFLQATTDGEAALAAAARETLAGARMVADLFAGLGSFAFHLSEPGRKLYAAEAARDPVLALTQAANARQLPVFAEHRDLFRNPLQADMLSRFDGLVLDPPRAGAEAQIAAIAASSLKRLCYVSCNPATFARDARTLCDAGFELKTVWPVGQFRWSTHVELASEFVRAG
ncbi:MAG: class I SAM-dependent RNA methyltransferase [Blastomonas fulva]|uniref:class I SAM-dependent RNA methyltransferase n=1 Tax=Blastomonas fulva TaxID=1550728 RepID=UPI0024E23E13|nr:class I SAM-dependent RNA methyltransferase [Blastomonas fulva]MDK2758635.1 class I SAM-dependent RNA methyltransferase [Blastomonas fulva]